MPTRTHVSPGLEIKAVELYKSGLSRQATARAVHLNEDKIREILVKHGVKIRPVGRQLGHVPSNKGKAHSK